MLPTWDLPKYLGLWYEIATYSSWFQPSITANAKAYYTANPDGTVSVTNTSVLQGQEVSVQGIATPLPGNGRFHVKFAAPEVAKVPGAADQQGFQLGSLEDPAVANYVVETIYFDKAGKYTFAIVTDSHRHSLYILSRVKHPTICEIKALLTQLAERWDLTCLTWVGQFD